MKEWIELSDRHICSQLTRWSRMDTGSISWLEVLFTCYLRIFKELCQRLYK